MWFRLILCSLFYALTVFSQFGSTHLTDQSDAVHQDDLKQSTSNDDDNLISCLNAIGDEVLTAQSTGWADAIKPYNLRISPIPTAMIVPQNVKSVQSIVACARKFPNTRLSPLGGKHGFTSAGLGGRDGAVVVFMKKFKDIELLPSFVHGSDTIVKVGGGVLVRELTYFLIENGQFSWPHARYTEVGVVGSAIGGGFGPSSRLHGTTLDNVVAIEIILPNGKLTRATEKENPDIFFAVLGAGASFGIIISIELKVHKVFPNPVTYSYRWNKPSLDEAVRAFTAFQEFGIQKAPPELGIRILLSLPDSITIKGLYYGDNKTFPSVMQDLLDQLPSPNVTSLLTTTFAESEALYTGPLEGPPPEEIHAITYTRSLVTFEPLEIFTIKTFLTNIFNKNKEKVEQHFRTAHFADLWGGLNSYTSKMMENPNNNDSSIQKYSFPHNGALLLIRGDGVLEQKKKNDDKIKNPEEELSSIPSLWPIDGIFWTQSFTKELFESQRRRKNENSSSSLISYPNYRDSDYTKSQWSEAYYGTQFKRLELIKDQVDPTGIMSADPQSIPNKKL